MILSKNLTLTEGVAVDLVRQIKQMNKYHKRP